MKSTQAQDSRHTGAELHGLIPRPFGGHYFVCDPRKPASEAGPNRTQSERVVVPGRGRAQLEPILKRDLVVCWASIAADITAPIGAHIGATPVQASADDLAPA